MRKPVSVGVMAKRTRKYVRGLARPHAAHDLAAVDAPWWDRKYADGVSDESTIGPRRDPRWVGAHYDAIGTLLEQDLHRRRWDISGADVLDIGSGAGHWVGWALAHGAASVTASDVARPSVDHLTGVWSGDRRVTVVHGTPADVAGSFDAVIAVGVMFHIVDDDEWVRTIERIGKLTRPGGWFAATGMFGRLGYANVQINDGIVTKRLRPYRRWKRELRSAGFGPPRLQRNRSWLRAPVPMPEAHVLTCVKP